MIILLPSISDLHTSQYKLPAQGVAKLRSKDRIRPADQFNPPAKYLAHFFKHHVSDCEELCNSIGCCLSLVDLSATAALSCKQHYKCVNKVV